MKIVRGDRYFVQWVTTIDPLHGYCIRDNQHFEWKIVFQHEDESVCKKVCKILNEGN
jgi:hypothetical protein